MHLKMLSAECQPSCPSLISDRIWILIGLCYCRLLPGDGAGFARREPDVIAGWRWWRWRRPMDCTRCTAAHRARAGHGVDAGVCVHRCWVRGMACERAQSEARGERQTGPHSTWSLLGYRGTDIKGRAGIYLLIHCSLVKTYWWVSARKT